MTTYIITYWQGGATSSYARYKAADEEEAAEKFHRNRIGQILRIQTEEEFDRTH